MWAAGLWLNIEINLGVLSEAVKMGAIQLHFTEKAAMMGTAPADQAFLEPVPVL